MLRVKQVKVEVTSNSDDSIKKSLSHKLKINKQDIIEYNIIKQSLDARDKNNIYYVYELDVNINNENIVLKNNKSNDITITPNMDYIFRVTGTKELKTRPIIVGSGPAGLFAAYFLAKYHYNPIIIERGECVEKRIESVNNFWDTGKLNLNSNVQFGEGGAGTFSDGKLNTLVKDKENRGREIFKIFIECGAPKEILYSYKPHIGTDILIKVVHNLREKIKNMGGTFLYNTCLTNIKIDNNHISKIEVNNKEWIDCDLLVLALGHSARDTFYMLSNYLDMEAKPFALGIRVQHSQDMINNSQYGPKYKDLLDPATYKLTYKSSNGRGVYSFCMCPGGYVVNASSELNKIAINGMSNYKRESENANSAIVVTITPNDFGNNPLDGIEYQRRLEELAYIEGKGNIPIQLLKDFKNNIKTERLGSIKPIFKGQYTLSNINNILPIEISESIKEAFVSFGYKIKGFDSSDTILAAIESRTSSPVRIIRDENLEANIKGIYPCGEGAGYAGGITSAAMDGVKVAEAIAQVYANLTNYKKSV